MRPILIFGAASWCTFLIVCAVTVFGLDQYEHAWGHWGSFQVEAWVSVLGSLVAMGAFGIASAFLRRTHGQITALVLGVGCSVLFVALCWLFNSVEFVGTVYTALLSLVVMSCLAAYAGEAIGS